MGLTRAGNHEEGAQEEPARNVTSRDEAATSQLLAGAVGDRCVNCEAPLAADQHYCIQCGERRGKSRFPASSAPNPEVGTTTPVTHPAPRPGRRRGWSGATVVAGIATLLLAMGVGVEIGRIGHNDNPGKTAAAPQVITVNGGGGGGTAQTTTAAAKTPTTKHTNAALAPKTEKKKAQAAAAASKPTQQAVKKASNAASSVLGGNAGQSNNTVTTGAQCKPGSAGCQNGHFTGTFFGQ